MEENNFILIPAHNEGNVKRYVYTRSGKLQDRKHFRFEYLRRTIQEIKKTGFRGRIIVVNDGSTDNTAQIAIEEGAEVINLRKRKGKAGAVFCGLAKIARSNPTSVLLMDADLVECELSRYGQKHSEDIEDLMRMTNKATQDGKVLQVIAKVRERTKPWAITEESGIRCFSKKAIRSIVRATKGSVREFQLEDYLNQLFKHHTEHLWTKLNFRQPIQTRVAVTYQLRKVHRKLPKSAQIKPIPRHK